MGPWQLNLRTCIPLKTHEGNYSSRPYLHRWSMVWDLAQTSASIPDHWSDDHNRNLRWSLSLVVMHVVLRSSTCLGCMVRNPRLTFFSPAYLPMPFSESKHGIDSNTYPPRSATSDLSLLKKDYLKLLVLKFEEFIHNPIWFAVWASKQALLVHWTTHDKSFARVFRLLLSLSPICL